VRQGIAPVLAVTYGFRQVKSVSHGPRMTGRQPQRWGAPGEDLARPEWSGKPLWIEDTMSTSRYGRIHIDLLLTASAACRDRV